MVTQHEQEERLGRAVNDNPQSQQHISTSTTPRARSLQRLFRPKQDPDHQHQHQRDIQQLGLQTSAVSPNHFITSTSTTSPISPEFDQISQLPTPLVTEMNSGAFSAISDQSLPSASSVSSAARRSPKKSYGPLTMRPSFNQQNSRIVSEFGSINSMDRFSSAMKTSLDPTLTGSQRSPQKRNISTPLKLKEKIGLEREYMNAESTPSKDPIIGDLHTVKESSTIFHKGIDKTGKEHTWRQIRQVGQGAFSTVILGELVPEDKLSPKDMQIAAIKIVQLPPHRETRTRVESSLKRELEILGMLSHPSIIKLWAVFASNDRYCIITPYCHGGDLFELASQHRGILKPMHIRRIFAETAMAVAYLHKNNIVHRDIKLENVLVNITFQELSAISYFDSKPIVTLTDFGLSRTIDPEKPLLNTRCGSEDYVPPELLIGLPYDGRQSDSWALGVLLYSIMESRLPFDPPPTKSIRARSRVAHRIARIEWAWNEFSDENEGKTWDSKDWENAKSIVENLLVRREKRMTSGQVCENEWVSGILSDEFRNF